MKKLILLISFLILSVNCFADGKYQDNNGKWFRKDFGNQDVISTSFNMCGCMNEAREYYPNKRDDQLQVMCMEAYTNYLLEISKRTNSISVGSYLNCKGEE